MAFDPIVYSSQQSYHQFIENLLLFNRNNPRYGRLVIFQPNLRQQQYTIQVKERDNWLLWVLHLFYKPQTERVKDLSDFTVTFFKNNKESAKKEALLSLRAIAALEPVLALTDTAKGELDKLKTELRADAERQHRDQQADLERKESETIAQINQDADAEVKRIGEENQKRIAELKESLCQNKHNSTKGDLEETKRLENSTEELKKQAAHYDELLKKCYDTLLVTKDDKKPVLCNMQVLSKRNNGKETAIGFMGGFSRDTMEKMTIPITEEEKKEYPHLKKKLDFAEYSATSVSCALDFYADNKALEKNAASVQTLIEIYVLADYLLFPELKQAAFNLIVKGNKFTLDDALALLHRDNDISLSDPLAQRCLFIVANNFIEASKKEEFTQIGHEQFICLMQLEALKINDEYEVFEAIKRWAKEQPEPEHQEGKSEKNKLKTLLYKNVGGKCLMDAIRFEHFSCERLESILDPKSEIIFTNEDMCKWLQLLLNNSRMPDAQANRSTWSVYQDPISGSMFVRWNTIILNTSFTSKQSFKIQDSEYSIQLTFQNDGYYYNENHCNLYNPTIALISKHSGKPVVHQAQCTFKHPDDKNEQSGLLDPPRPGFRTRLNRDITIELEIRPKSDDVKMEKTS